MKISTRLYVAAAIPVVVSIALIAFVFVFYSEVEHQMERHELAMEVNTAVTELKMLMYEYLSARSERAEQQWFSRYDGVVSRMQEGVKVLELDESTYSAFADLDDLFLELIVNQQEMQQIIQQEPSQAKLDILIHVEQILTAQLLVNSEMIAADMTLAVENAHSSMTRAQQMLGAVTYGAMGFLALAAVGVAIFTARRILAPLRLLVDYSQKVGAGEYAPEIEVKGRDEIARVTSTVKTMVGRLLAAQRELKTQRDHLDDMVEERTTELTQTNQQLRAEITERKRAEELLQQTTDRIERLHETAHNLELCEDEDQVYRLTVDAAETILSFSLASLYIVEEDRLVVKATSSASPSGASREEKLEKGGLAAKTYRTKETTVFGRIEDVPEAAPTQTEFKSGISTPIGDIGVFQVASTNANAFTAKDARLLELLLSYTAEAVKRIRLQQELEQQAIHDALTGAYNRRYLDQTIEQELQRSKRYNHSIGFLMIDIDRFKEINDRFGHQMGDKVLQTVANVLHEQVRENDLVIRYGGDEFLIVLPETDGTLEVIRERIQQAVATRNKENPLLDFPVTLSIGAAHWQPEDDLSIEQVLAKADKSMYEEKGKKSTS